MSAESDPILAVEVSCGDGYKPFGEMTAAEVRSRAEELSAAAGAGPVAQPIAPVASAWRGLADEMEREGASKVADLELDDLPGRAERLRIVPRGGSLL